MIFDILGHLAHAIGILISVHCRVADEKVTVSFMINQMMK